jgi:hypothetical protein
MVDPVKPTPPTAAPVAPLVAAPQPARGPGWSPRLRWFLAEFLVVVAGVLVALALNSWANGRQDIAREQSYLRQLHADLGNNEADLAAAVAFLDERAAASARVLHRFWSQAPVADAAFIDDLMKPRSTRRFRPVLGAAEALISTGDLNLIRSDAVRAAILDYVESMRTHLDAIDRHDETYYRPAVVMLLQGPDIQQHSTPSAGDDRLRLRPNQVVRVPFPSVLDEMLSDRTVYDGYSFLLLAHRNQTLRYADMLAETQALRSLIGTVIEP